MLQFDLDVRLVLEYPSKIKWGRKAEGQDLGRVVGRRRDWYFWGRGQEMLWVWQVSVSDEQIYGVNRSGSARVWDSEVKSSQDASRYGNAAPYIPLLSSDGPYMDWPGHQLTSECTADLLELNDHLE